MAELQPLDLESVQIPRAGAQLDAIVKATEGATNTIMTAAEEILSNDDLDPQIEQACMQIFEACSFQDITGQRISRVVETLNHIEDRIAKFKDLWGADSMVPAGDAEPMGRIDGDVLLEGPALEGEGIDQSAVDSLLDAAGSNSDESESLESIIADSKAEKAAEPEAESENDGQAAAPESAPEGSEAKKELKAEAGNASTQPAVEKKVEPKPAAPEPAPAPVAEKKVEPKPAAPAPKPEPEPAAEAPAPAKKKAAAGGTAEAEAEPEEESSQADIDAMFN